MIDFKSRFTHLTLSWLALGSLAPLGAWAMPGLLDTNFNATVSGSYVHSLAAAPDGKVVIGGNFTRVNGTVRNAIARLNSDGTLDSSFSPGNGPNSEVLAVALHTNGKPLIGGYFNTVSGVTRNRIARLDTDGSLDPTFDPGLGANGGIRVIRVQDDGKILIGGDFVRISGTPRSCIARLNPDGTLDATFDPGKGVGGYLFLNAMGIQGDGKILIGGDFSTYNGVARGSIARLNPDGGLDTSFDSGQGTTLDNPIMSLAVQQDGKIVIAGSFFKYNGVSRVNIARLNSDGSLDTTFDPGRGISGGLYNMIQSVAVQGDGKILAGGSFDRVNGALRNNLVLLHPNGMLDTNFTTKVDSPVRYIVVQADGQVLLGGEFSRVNGAAHNRIARLQADVPATAGFRLLGPEYRVGSFHCQVQGPASSIFVVEASTDLVRWSPIYTNTCGQGGVEFDDPGAANFSCCYYRVR